MTLTGKRILLGITGGIAAYKAAELVRLLVKAGADVRVAMTEAATRFITPVTLQALSGQNVWTDLWDARIADNMGHIELSRDRELILVAPASADFLAKLAHGLADDLLSTLCLARRCPLMVAPAMNVEMWENVATARNAETLRADGVVISGPASGGQACGEMGMGRMTEPADILADVEFFFQPKRLQGKRVVVTAGPTEEPVDPVRVLTNTSSGKMGYAVARAAQEAGAEVTLISGPVSLPTPAGVARVDVRTAREMFDAVKRTQSRPTFSSRWLRLPITASSIRPARKSRRRTAAVFRSNSKRTRTSSPGWRRCRKGRSASASPRKARSWASTQRKSARARTFR